MEFKQLTYNVWCLKPISLNITNPALNLLIDFSSVLSLWKQQRSINRSGEAETAPAEGLLGAVPDLWWFWLRATRHWQNRKQAGSEHAPQAQMRLLFGQVAPYCFYEDWRSCAIQIPVNCLTKILATSVSLTLSVSIILDLSVWLHTMRPLASDTGRCLLVWGFHLRLLPQHPSAL